jgi:hypothetical protein
MRRLIDLTNCNPVWYHADKGFARDVQRFRDFHAELDTTLCLAFECPDCSSVLKGQILINGESELVPVLTVNTYDKGRHGGIFKCCCLFHLLHEVQMVRRRSGIQTVPIT